MNYPLPVLCLALVIVSALLPSTQPKGPETKKLAETDYRAMLIRFGIAVALTVAVALLAQKFGKAGDGLSVGIGSGLACVLALAATWIEKRETSVALGVLGGSLFALVPPANLPSAEFALIGASGFLALAFAGEQAILALLTGSVLATSTFLGASAVNKPSAPTVGVLVLVAGLVGAILEQVIRKQREQIRLPHGSWAAVCAALAGLIIGNRILPENGLTLCILLGVIASGVTLGMVSDEPDQDSLVVGIVAVIWLSAASVAFGLLRGFGMSLTLVSAVAVLAFGGGKRALLSVGPLVGLVLYRLLREAQPEVSRALDIGQHYALVGFALGMICPLIPSDWRTARRTDSVMSSVLWSVLALGLPVVVMLVFGGVGAVGLIAGTGFAAIAQALRGRLDLQPLAVGLGVAGEMLLLTGWVDSITGLQRDEKLRALSIAASLAALVAGALFAVAKRAQSKTV